MGNPSIPSIKIASGWWLSHPSENFFMFISWDDEIPNIYIYMEKNLLVLRREWMGCWGLLGLSLK